MNADSPMPDLAECARFAVFWCEVTGLPHLTLTAITPDGPTTTATFQPGEAAKLQEWIAREQSNGRNVYFQPNETPTGCASKAAKQHMVAAVCRHADVDPDDDHFPLAEERERLARLAERLAEGPDMPPTAIIDSGNGMQMLWAVAREALGAEVVERIESENRSVEATLGAFATHDVSRLLRLPGTVNFPNAKKRGRGRGISRARLVHALPRSYRAEEAARLGDHLAKLLVGSPFVRARAAQSGKGRASGGADAGSAKAPDLLERIAAAAAIWPTLARRWGGDWSGLNGDSRSEKAMALGGVLKRAGFTFAEMSAAMALHPDLREWTHEKGAPNGARELHNVWDKADVAVESPAMSILQRSACPAPALPLAVFGPFWSDWIARAAEGANAPPDYVALPLLALASSLLGNARWVVAWKGWAEPPALWSASVGNPSSGKSSGAAPVTRDVLGQVERHLSKDYPRELERWETVASVARAVLKQWEKDTAKAIKNSDPVPEKPPEAMIPPKPIRPRARVVDVTVEKMASILEALPKGVLYVRDELAGWLLNLSRYANGGSDRPFWLEAYVGGAMQVDRVKHPDPVLISHLTVPVFGTIQPDRLGDVLRGADDGLPSRFLWSWPEAQPFAQPAQTANIEAAASRLLALAALGMARDAEGHPMPSYVHLAPAARDVLSEFARDVQVRENTAHGLLKSALGKARGQALRLAAVLEYLWWCGDGGNNALPGVGVVQPEPVMISLQAMRAAAGLLDAYFLPMAQRVLGDAAIPEDERNARTLATWIMETRPERVNVSSIRDDARLPGLRESDPVKAACRFLREARWLIEAPSSGGPGRPRGDYIVNPKVWDAAP